MTLLTRLYWRGAGRRLTRDGAVCSPSGAGSLLFKNLLRNFYPFQEFVAAF